MMSVSMRSWLRRRILISSEFVKLNIIEYEHLSDWQVFSFGLGELRAFLMLKIGR